MMKHRLVLAAICLLTGGVAGYTMRSLRDDDGDAKAGRDDYNQAQGGFENSAMARSTSAAAARKGATASAGSDSAAMTGNNPAISLGQRMKELLADFDWKLIEREAAKLSAADLQAALVLVAAMPKSGDRDSLRWYLYRAWAAKNPEAAWQASLADPLDAHSGYLLGAVAGELAKTQPSAAINLALSLGMGARRTSVLREVIDEWSKLDIAAVIAWSNTHSDLTLDSGAFSRGLRFLAEKDPLQAANLAITLNDTQARSSSVYSLMQFWAGRDPAAAIGWAQGIANPKQREAAMAAAVSTWANTDPLAAFAFAERIPDAATRASAMQNAWNDWFRKDPAAAVVHLGSGKSDALLQGLTWRFSDFTESFTPQERASLLALLPEGKAKQDIFTNLADHHIRRGQYNQAMELLNGMPDSSDRDRSVVRLGEDWAAADLAAATAWIKVQPDSTDRDLAIAGYARSLARSDPASAAQWAASIPDKGIRQSAQKNIAVRWLASDPARAEAWVAGVSDLSESEKQYLRDTVAKYGDNTQYGVSVGQRR